MPLLLRRRDLKTTVFEKKQGADAVIHFCPDAEVDGLEDC